MSRSSDTPFTRSADRERSGAPGAEPSCHADSAEHGPTGTSGPHPSFAALSGTVFCADPALVNDTPVETLPEGFAGRLSFRGPESLGYDETVSALQRLGMLISWAQAQQARVAARLEVLFARDIAEASGREEPALALSLAAAEASTVLNIPHMTAMQLISESSRLCADAPETLARLSEGKIALQHARIILEETHNLPTDLLEVPEDEAAAGAGPAAAGSVDPDASGAADDPSAQDSGQLDLGLDDLSTPGGEGTCPDSSSSLPDGVDGAEGKAGAAAAANSDTCAGVKVLTVRGAFELDLLAAAEGRTAAGFGRRARRLRESRFPDLIPVRHRQAKDKRRVTFQPLPDGMSCLSAIIAAEKGQALFAALTGAAKAGKRAGDPRTMDQLRVDILTDLLLEDEPAAEHTPGTGTDTSTVSGAADGTESGTGCGSGTGTGTGTGTVDPSGTSAASRTSARTNKRPRRAERHRNQNRSKVRTEVMVLINADTLAGLDENSAELNGYGPISAQSARAMFLDALHWTPLLQDPATGEILNVGRTRRIPAGLKRWLQARDGTCRFPGCSVSVTHAEIDHTTPFSHGGPTDHANLEHLCPKHHRFKTLGHWKARQPQAGTIEWNSPTGRTYTTDAALDFTPPDHRVTFKKGAKTGLAGGNSDSGCWYGFGDVAARSGLGESAAAQQAEVADWPANDPPALLISKLSRCE
ncbi:MAG: DUF222 domain-containing protein [Arthrobacter sp.]